MYFSLLHKKTPENCSLNVLEKSYFCRYQVIEFFSTTRNDWIFIFPRALPDTCISVNLCIFVYYSKKHQKIAVPTSSKKFIFVGIRFSNFFRLLETTEYLFFLGLFQILVSEWTYVFWFIAQENSWNLHPKGPQKSSYVSVPVSRIFFRLIETTEFLFFLGLFQTLVTA